ncbi:nuclear transport factor 2 family protein [Chitinimonas sp.]|uniref:nuclear transport factor 2 family protein n=1 Tax=Chitinimonas sp. TaxID=1934313 RepID=UPI0035B2CEC0
MQADFQQAVGAYWQTAIQRDWAAFSALLHPDVVYEVPQTRERIRGRDHYVEFNRSWPFNWHAELRDIVADATQAVSRIAYTDEQGACEAISFFRFRDGLISHITDYWPAEYEPPARVVDCIERY